MSFTRIAGIDPASPLFLLISLNTTEGVIYQVSVQETNVLLPGEGGPNRSDFCACCRRCRHISAAALKSCSERDNSKINALKVFGQSEGLSRPGHVSRK